MIDSLTAFVLSLIHTLPLGVFIPLISFFEEVIAPIPSLVVMTTVGSFLAARGSDVADIVPLALLGAFGKVCGALILYTAADKIEDFVTRRPSGLFGITHDRIESFGARFGHGWRDYVILTLLRSAPAMPSSAISIACGAIKVPLPLFIVATFIGTTVRNTFYLYIGYTGATALHAIVTHSETVESVVQIGILVLALAGGGYLYYRWRQKDIERPH